MIVDLDLELMRQELRKNEETRESGSRSDVSPREVICGFISTVFLLLIERRSSNKNGNASYATHKRKTRMRTTNKF